MSTTLNLIVVHIDESVDTAALDNLEQGIRQKHGVVSANHQSNRNHLIVVGYDWELTRAAKVLHSFQERGLHVQLLGM